MVMLRGGTSKGWLSDKAPSSSPYTEFQAVCISYSSIAELKNTMQSPGQLINI